MQLDANTTRIGGIVSIALAVLMFAYDRGMLPQIGGGGSGAPEAARDGRFTRPDAEILAACFEVFGRAVQDGKVATSKDVGERFAELRGLALLGEDTFRQKYPEPMRQYGEALQRLMGVTDRPVTLDDSLRRRLADWFADEARKLRG